MTVKAIMRLLVQLSFWIVCLVTPLASQTNKRLWVLGETGELTEYNPSTFTPIHTIKVPLEALKNPHNLAINSKGQVLATLGPGPTAGKAWFWNGQTAMSIDRGVTRRTVPGFVNISATEGVPQCALSADGRQIYWFENEFSKIESVDSGTDISVKTNFLAWQIDLESGRRVQVANFSFAPCKCGTGSCLETCPQADFWIPENGVDDFFIVTHWVPGQLGSTYQSSFLYREAGGKWSSRKLPEVMERVQDAAQGGTIIVYSLLDSACCGRQNESNDQTLLMRNGKNVVLFDERERYQNPDYDVSFFTSNARLSPDAGSVALTISSSAQPEAEIRLSESGRADARELAGIRQAIQDLPAVEVLRMEVPPKRSGLIPQATLVGWLNNQEVLVIENGALVAFNIATGVQRKSEVKVPKESLVYIR